MSSTSPMIAAARVGPMPNMPLASPWVCLAWPCSRRPLECSSRNPVNSKRPSDAIASGVEWVFSNFRDVLMSILWEYCCIGGRHAPKC